MYMYVDNLYITRYRLYLRKSDKKKHTFLPLVTWWCRENFHDTLTLTCSLWSDMDSSARFPSFMSPCWILWVWNQRNVPQSICKEWLIHISGQACILKLLKSFPHVSVNMFWPQICVIPMWVKQCHKAPMTGNGKNTIYEDGDDWWILFGKLT